MMLGANDATDRAPIVDTTTGRALPAVCQSSECTIVSLFCVTTGRGFTPCNFVATVGRHHVVTPVLVFECRSSVGLSAVGVLSNSTWLRPLAEYWLLDTALWDSGLSVWISLLSGVHTNRRLQVTTSTSHPHFCGLVSNQDIPVLDVQ